MNNSNDSHGLVPWHGTTIVGIKRGDRTVIAGDGQVSMGNTVMKPNARKVRRIGDGSVIAGFAGATADAFTLFERLEAKLETFPGQLMRACVELAKDWRLDRRYRRLEALLIVADKDRGQHNFSTTLVLDPGRFLLQLGTDFSRKFFTIQ